MTLRVLYVSHSFPLPGRPLSNVGGMQRVAVELHRALEEHPQVELHSRVLRTSWRWTGVRMAPFMAGLLREIPRVVREQRIDVVLFSSMVTAALAVPLRRAIARAGAITAAIPVGRDVTLPNPAYQRFVPRVFDALDLVFPISRATGDTCLQRGLDPARMHIVPCGVDLDRFPAHPDRAADRRALLARLSATGEPIPESSLLLCSVGRHQERKGFHWFVDRVMPLLPPDVVYLLGGEGPMTPAVRDAARRHGVESRVRLLGRVSEETLTALYRGADLFVMPNVPVPGDIEGFGVVMLEAGACGLPTLAADLEGIRDVVEEGRNGHLLPSQDAPAFAGTILRYRSDRDALAALSASAARHTAHHFAWPAIADQFVAVLQGSLPERDRAPLRAAG